MKHCIILLLLLLPIGSKAQENIISQDTTLYVNGRKIVIREQGENIKVKLYEQIHKGDTIENDQLFEGVYKNGRSTERRILFSYPFNRRNPRNFLAGEYIGLATLTHPGEIRYRQGRSWEFGVNIFEIAKPVSKNWTVAIGAGVKSIIYGYKGNGCLQEDAEGVSHWLPAPDGSVYKRSRLLRSGVVIPIVMDWQASSGKKNSFYIQGGVEWELPICYTSVDYKEGDGDDKIRYKNFRYGNINLLFRAGYSEYGLYVRYSCMPLFEEGKGPNAHPLTFGFYWSL